jgi:hypothetical protein
MIALRLPPPAASRRLVEWDPRNLSIDFNTRYRLFTPPRAVQVTVRKEMITAGQ